MKGEKKITAISMKMDEKGRITLSKKIRDRLNLSQGDTLFLHEGISEIIIKKAENPFDVIAQAAREEYKKGETTSLDDFTSDMGITTD